jgi:RHS repeat-associated protein
VLAAVYDTKGRVTSMTDSSKSRNGVFATTWYEWVEGCNGVARITRPEGTKTEYGYDPTTCNRLWQQDGRGASSRVNYTYYPSTGLVATVKAPLSPADSIFYDNQASPTFGVPGLGNVFSVKSARGMVSRSIEDAIGNDTLFTAPIDSLQTLLDTVRVAYDVMSRDTSKSHIAARVYGSGSQMMWVRTFYGQEGQVDSVHQRSSPDDAGVDWIKHSWRYDLAGRVVAEYPPGGERDSTVYDAASNVIRTISRRGYEISSTYDAKGNRLSRSIPSVNYARRTANEGEAESPRYPNNGTGYLIAADTEVFTHDIMGNILTADNNAARIRRTYSLDGSLATDSLWTRTWAELNAGGNFTSHVYGLRFFYDLEGREIALKHPQQLAPRSGATAFDSVAYSYDLAGKLEVVKDLFGRSTTWLYDSEGRPSTVTYPGGVVRTYAYANAEISRHLVSASNFIGSDSGFSAPMVRNDSLWRNGQGRVVRASSLMELGEYVYSGLGHLTWAEVKDYRASRTNPITTYALTRSDALGNEYASVHDNSIYFWPSSTNPEYRNGTTRRTESSDMCGSSESKYDASGSVELFRLRRNTCDIFHIERLYTFSYYDAANRLRVTDGDSYTQSNVDYQRFFEEYRYDALGRRILKRTRAPNACVSDTHCKSAIERYVWDGNQLLYEIRGPGFDTVSNLTLEQDTVTRIPDGRFYGRVAYVHGIQLDQPIQIVRIGYGYDWGDGQGYYNFGNVAFVPHFGWRGEVDTASFDNGTAKRCRRSGTGVLLPNRCFTIDWQLSNERLYGRRKANPYPTSWMGSFVRGSTDANGQVYFRNRYYDPYTARFTQEDPIGLAGGQNLYGYASGDPVNLSDPFGLCVPVNVCLAVAGFAIGAGGRLAYNLYMGNKWYDGVGTAGLYGGAIGLTLGAAAPAITAALTTSTTATVSTAVVARSIPVVPSAAAKLNVLAQKFGTTADEIKNSVLTNGQRFVDLGNKGHVNALLARPDGVSGFVRVTLNPAEEIVISAGLMRANQVANAIANGRLLPK